MSLRQDPWRAGAGKKEALSQMGAFGLEGYENEYPSALSGECARELHF
ncbi:MAG: hypothetical protein ACLTBL_06425 [Clostridium sp.]